MSSITKIKGLEASMDNDHFEVLKKVFGGAMDAPSIMQGLTNLAQLPPLDIENQLPAPYRNKRFTQAKMGFKFINRELKVAIAARGAKPQFIPTAKFIAMVELMNDPKHCTVVLQNFTFPGEKRDGQAQILGRILPHHSAINIAHGKVGIPIHDFDDILHLDSFQIDRMVLSAYYLASKLQIGNEDSLDNLIAAYEGVRFYELPTGLDEAVVMTDVATLLG